MERQAIDIAIDMVNRPLLIREVQRSPLPAGVRDVMRLATSSDSELEQVGKGRGRDANALRQAAMLFLQQALFYPGADSYRILGLNQGASAAEIREHRRLLLKWLHPDRNPSSWEQLLFHRVITAAADLEKSLARSSTRTQIIASPPPRSYRIHSRVNRFPKRQKQPSDWRARLRAYLWRAALVALLLSLGGGIVRLFAGETKGEAIVQISQTRMN